jgi:adenylate cyclase
LAEDGGMNVLARLRGPIWRSVLLGLGCGLLVWLLSFTSEMRSIEDWYLDWCFDTRGQRHSAAKIVIIDLDEAFLDALGKPYMYLSPEVARVVRHAKRQGARAIALDVFVPDSLSDFAALSQPDGEGSARGLGQAILEAGNVVLPEWAFSRAHAGGTAIERRRPLLQWRTKSLLRPEPTDLGFVNLTEDGDQFVRRQQLAMRYREENSPSDQVAPSLALATVCRARGLNYDFANRGEQLRIGDEPVPWDANQRMAINFVGPPGSVFPVLSIKDVLAAADQEADVPLFQDAIVLIGTTSRTSRDLQATPYANNYASMFARQEPGLMPGVEIQANIIATLEDRAYLWAVPSWAMLLLLLGTGVGLALAFARVRLVLGLGITVIHHFAWKLVALAAFVLLYWRVEMAAMLLLGVVVTAAHLWLRWRMLRQMLGVVKSEQIAMALEADPEQLHRIGEQREVTVLFADIRNFTDFANQHSPAEVLKFLNAYYGAIVPGIEAQGGALTTYIGDGIMVVFGAPQRQPDHAHRAVRSAVAILKAVHEQSAEWKRLGFDGLRVGVGVHTGSAVVGSMGSPKRLDYTAIGDTVNAASRIEGMNKEFHTEILITAETYESLKSEDRLGIEPTPRPAKLRGIQREFLLHEVRV